MMKKRFTQEQIAFAIRQAEGGTAIEEILRRLGISEATFYRWKKKYAGLGVAEDAASEAAGGGEPAAKASGGGLGARQADAPGRALKKTLKPAVRRYQVRRLEVAYQVSERRACGALGFPRSSHRYESVADPQPALRIRLRELASVRGRLLTLCRGAFVCRPRRATCLPHQMGEFGAVHPQERGQLGCDRRVLGPANKFLDRVYEPCLQTENLVRGQGRQRPEGMAFFGLRPRLATCYVSHSYRPNLFARRSAP